MVGDLRSSRNERLHSTSSARAVQLQLTAELPELLRSRGYQLQFSSADGARFELPAAAAHEVAFRLQGGSPLDAASLPTDPEARSLIIRAEADGLPIGGVSFVIDPELAD